MIKNADFDFDMESSSMFFFFGLIMKSHRNVDSNHRNLGFNQSITQMLPYEDLPQIYANDILKCDLVVEAC